MQHYHSVILDSVWWQLQLWLSSSTGILSSGSLKLPTLSSPTQNLQISPPTPTPCPLQLKNSWLSIQICCECRVHQTPLQQSTLSARTQIRRLSVTYTKQTHKGQDKSSTRPNLKGRWADVGLGIRGSLEVWWIGQTLRQLVRCQLRFGSLRVVDAGRGKVAEVRSLLSQLFLHTLVKHGLSCATAVKSQNQWSIKCWLSFTP